MTKQKDLLKKSVEAPAQFLDRTVVATQGIASVVPVDKALKKSEDYWHLLGPGLTTGAADDDPSGIATYSQTGAKYGFQLLWLAPLTFPMMAIVQEMCARIGLVTGRGLAANIRLRFSKKLVYFCTMLLFVANAVNIGADIGAMAQAAQLLNSKWNTTLLVIGFTLVCLLLQIFTPYVKYARYLKWLALVLLAYVFSTLSAHLDWVQVLRHAALPSLHFTKEQILLICAIFGTTISPYLFFWQTSQEVEEQILQGQTTVSARRGATPGDIKSMRIDVWSGMALSNLVMFFIIAACGALLFPNGVTNINSASQAAEALRPFAGDATYLLFAAGIIGTGMLAIPILAGSASYALAKSFRWRAGLYRNLKQAYAFYGVIIISMMVGLAMNFIGLNPIKALIYAAILNGLVAPIVLFMIVVISSDKKLMGPWVNRRSTTLIGWLVTGLMGVVGVAAIVALF